MKHRVNYPILALIIANIIWAAAPAIFKFALSNIPPFTLGLIRFALASLIFLPAAVARWKPIALHDFMVICLTAFFTIFVNIVFLFFGLALGASINAAMIYTAGPIFMFILAVLLLGERPRARVFYGMLMGLVGALIIILSPLILSGGNKDGTFGVVANVFYVISTLGIVVGTVTGKRVLERVNAYQFTFIAFAFASLLFGLFAIPELSNFSLYQLDIAGWTGIVYGVLFSSAIAYGLYYYGTSKIDATEIGIFTYVDPVVAVFLAAPLLGEFPSPLYLVGASLVFIGIFVAEGRIPWHPIHRVQLKSVEISPD